MFKILGLQSRCRPKKQKGAPMSAAATGPAPDAGLKRGGPEGTISLDNRDLGQFSVSDSHAFLYCWL